MTPDMYSILAVNIIDILEINCMNQDKGCQVKLLKKKLLLHEADCLYTENIICPYRKCQARVSRYSILRHCTDRKCIRVDEDKLKPEVTMGVTVSSGKNLVPWWLIPQCYFIEGSEDKILILGDPLNKGECCVFYVKLLSKDKLKKFPIKLEVSSLSGEFSVSYRMETANLEDDLKSVVKAANAVTIPDAAIQKFIVDDNIKMKISVTIFDN